MPDEYSDDTFRLSDKALREIRAHPAMHAWMIDFYRKNGRPPTQEDVNALPDEIPVERAAVERLVQRVDAELRRRGHVDI